MKAKKYEDRLEHAVTLTGNKKTDGAILKSVKHMVDDHWRINRATYGGVIFDRYEVVEIKGVKFIVVEVDGYQGSSLVLRPMDDE